MHRRILSYEIFLLCLFKCGSAMSMYAPYYRVRKPCSELLTPPLFNPKLNTLKLLIKSIILISLFLIFVKFLYFLNIFIDFFGVVEATSSNLITQTKNRRSKDPQFFFIYLAKSLKISPFRDIKNGRSRPCFQG